MAKKSKVVGILILIVLIMLVATAFTVLMFGKEDAEKTNICKTDSDCIKTQITCCPCSMGGEEKCVVQSEVEKYQAELDKCPKNQMCVAMYSCNIQSCSCVNGNCIEILDES
jgi:hypothetical protein